MKASELIEKGLKQGDSVYYCIRRNVKEYKVLYIDESKEKKVIYVGDKHGVSRIVDDIDLGYELTRHSAAATRLEDLKCWQQDLQKLIKVL